MQRELLFRVWDKELKHFNSPNVHRIVKTNEFLSLDLHAHIIKISGHERFLIQQFTGLLDSKGQKIFEGDVVKYNYEEAYGENKGQHQIFQVIWCDFYKAWALADGNGQSLNHTGWKFYNLDAKGEVIGNIFQNPKLLKQ